ncbi:endo-1,3(4)-beta-glucanase 1-like [Chenopodium quinoa]|uniref:endo-1,3(4)-beta-glucanase 1-like n=1 Tax=Chenopodium quinoa TaxID=63459 RepID=UPI000B76FB87|nr:endo-1,3(4)-beta-glucanase 1-like [Chenopodium quinoa]
MAPKLETPSSSTSQFCFPLAFSNITPNPSNFFSPKLLSSALPTTSFFTNFTLENGDQPIFVHPYLVKLSLSSLSLSYPSLTSSSSSISQDFSPDFTISTSQSSPHLVSAFSDLTVTVDFLASDFRFLLARGSPYVTLEVSRPLPLLFATNSAIQTISSSSSQTKHRIELENNQTWVVYSSSELNLEKQDDTHFKSSKSFSGVVRIAVIPQEKTNKFEEILDFHNTCYPTNGEAVFSTPFSLDYKWEKKGWGELLMLAHLVHVKLLLVYNSGVKVLDDFRYKSIDGDLVGIVGNRWNLRVDNIPISWHSIRGIPEESYPEIVTALWKDVGALGSNPISTTNVYYYSMQVSRAARLALIAEEVNCLEVIPGIRKFLRDSIEPWLVGSFEKNAFLYDEKWGGVVSKHGSVDPEADDGFGFYNNHVYALGYFVFSIAVLSKIDVQWGMKFKRKVYALVASYMSLGKGEKSKYTKLRSFDVYKLHSWTRNLNDDHERNSENPSASINAYYSAALLGKVFGDDHLVAIGSTLASFEIEAAKTWWHVKEGQVMRGNSLRRIKWLV